eukprot:6867140-Pyramimonas_sp.AAC.1
MGKRRTGTIDSAADRHEKRVSVSLDSWLRAVLLNLPLNPRFVNSYPVSQLAVVRHLELVQAEHTLKSGGHTGEDLPCDVEEHQVALASSLQRNEPEQ